jgi:hypothetical protein
MQPTKIPDESSRWPEFCVNGDTKAPRAWVFYLSEAADKFGPMTLTARDEAGRALVYHRAGYMPRAVQFATNTAGWLMFSGGAMVAVLAMTFLSCYQIEPGDLAATTGTESTVSPIDGEQIAPKMNELGETGDESGELVETGDDSVSIDGDWSDPIDDSCVRECYGPEVEKLGPICDAIPNDSRCIPAIVDAAKMRCAELCEWTCVPSRKTNAN